MSVAYPERTYVGQCENLERRIRNHNSGHGSEGTAPAVYLPYAPAAYLTNLGHMNESERMSLEHSWQCMNERVVRVEGMIDIESRIENGRRVMEIYNELNSEENHIRLITCMKT